jgi:nucleolar protein 15
LRLANIDWSSDEDDSGNEGLAVNKMTTKTSSSGNTNNPSSGKSAFQGKNNRRLVDKLGAAASSSHKDSSSVLYFGHLPREFGENELKRLLGQFGRVKRACVARSRKTGGHRGFAFVEMSNPEVADIVAQTFSGYLLMGRRRLVCHVVPAEQVRTGRPFFQPKRSTRAEPVRTLDRMQVITARLLEREKLKRQRLADLGIEYDFPGYAAVAETGKVSGKSAESPAKTATTPPSDLESSKSRRRKESLSSVEPEEGPVASEKARWKKRKDSDGSRGAEEGYNKGGMAAASERAPETKNHKSRKGSDATLESSKSPDESLASPPSRRNELKSSAEKESSSKKKSKSKRKNSQGSDCIEERVMIDESLPEKQNQSPPPPPSDRTQKAPKRKSSEASAEEARGGGSLAVGRARDEDGTPNAYERRRPTSERKKKDKKKDKDRRASAP